MPRAQVAACYTSWVLGYVATLASILAALAAVFAFGLGVTRTARLRRREQLFREALGVFAADDRAKDIVTELHRAAMGEIIARQLTSPWRAVWPWGVWLGVIALAGQIGYLTSDYLASGGKWNYFDFGAGVLGDPAGSLLWATLLLGGLPQVFSSYVFTVVGRAEVARNFVDGVGIGRPGTYTEFSTADFNAWVKSRRVASRPEAEQQDWKVRWARGILAFGRSVVPGLFATSLGVFIGILYWLKRQHGDRLDDLRSLGALPGIVALSVSLLGMMTLLVALQVSAEVRR